MLSENDESRILLDILPYMSSELTNFWNQVKGKLNIENLMRKPVLLRVIVECTVTMIRSHHPAEYRMHMKVWLRAIG